MFADDMQRGSAQGTSDFQAAALTATLNQHRNFAGALTSGLDCKLGGETLYSRSRAITIWIHCILRIKSLYGGDDVYQVKENPLGGESQN
jgi:hypothetical protein